MVREAIKPEKVIQAYLKCFPQNIRVEEVFLFGSYAKGDFSQDSDLDLIIVSPDFKNIGFLKRLEMLSSFRKSKITRTMAMDVIGYTPEEFRNIDRESVIMKRAKKEGRIVHGGIQSTNSRIKKEID